MFVTVLHPRHKLSYFKSAGWDHNWIETAEQLVRDEFDLNYAGMEVSSGNDSEIDAVETPRAHKVCYVHEQFTG
jgi:hypothetical protein